MKEEIVYLTFPTNRRTAHLLTEFAHIQGITQPKLIDRICREYIEDVMIEAMEKIEKTNNIADTIDNQ